MHLALFLPVCIRVGKESTCQCRRCRFHTWVGKMPWRRNWLTHSSILAWRSPWPEEPGRVQSLGSQKSQTRLRDWTTTITTTKWTTGNSWVQLTPNQVQAPSWDWATKASLGTVPAMRWGEKEKEGGGLAHLEAGYPHLMPSRIYHYSDPQTWSMHIRLSLSNRNPHVLGLKHRQGKGERRVSALPLIFAA